MAITTEIKTELGTFISSDYITVLDYETVENATQLLRTHKTDFQNKPTYLYVTDRNGKLTGVLRVRDLLTENPKVSVAKIMKRSVLHVSDNASLQEVIQIFSNYSFSVKIGRASCRERV